MKYRNSPEYPRERIYERATDATGEDTRNTIYKGDIETHYTDTTTGCFFYWTPLKCTYMVFLLPPLKCTYTVCFYCPPTPLKS